jgi:hypothetical protein
LSNKHDPVALERLESLRLSIDCDAALERWRRYEHLAVAAPTCPCAEIGDPVSATLLTIDHTTKSTNLIRFVAVAGVGTKATHEWTDASGNAWLTGVQTPGIGLYSYDHNISKSDPNLWQSLSEHGQNLLQSLLSLIDNQHVWA